MDIADGNTISNGKAAPGRLIIPLIVLVLIGLLYFISAHTLNIYEHDSSLYMGVARSLANGEGYQFNNRPHTLYPPGLPLILSGVMLVFGENYAIFYKVISIFSFLVFLTTYFYYRKRGEPWGLFLCLVMALSPVYYAYAVRAVFSDIPYMFFSIGFIYCYELLTSRAGDKKKWLYFAIGGILFFMAMITRSISLALLAGLCVTLVHQFIRGRITAKKKKSNPVFIISLIIIGFVYFMIWSSWAKNNTIPLYEGEYRHSYSQQIQLIDPHHPDLGNTYPLGVVLRVIENIPVQGAHIAEGFSNIHWIKPLWFSPLIVLVFLFGIIGWIAELKRPNPLVAWYVFFYFGILLIWPYDEGKRFFLSIEPFVLLFCACGLRAAANWIIDTKPARIGVIGIAAGIAGIIGSGIQTAFTDSASKQDYGTIAFWVLILAAGLILLLTGRKIRKPAHIGRYLSVIGILYLAAQFTLGIPEFKVFIDMSRNPDQEKISNAPDYRACQWLEANSEVDDVFMANNFAGIHFSSGRHVVPLPITAKKDVLLKALNSANPRYIVINDPLEYAYFLPVEPERFRIMKEALPENAFKLVHEYKGGKIYSYSRDGFNNGS